MLIDILELGKILDLSCDQEVVASAGISLTNTEKHHENAGAKVSDGIAKGLITPDCPC